MAALDVGGELAADVSSFSLLVGSRSEAWPSRTEKSTEKVFTS